MMSRDERSLKEKEWFQIGYLLGVYPGLAKLLELCRSGPYTRELLNEVKAWGNGQFLLKLAVKYGLAERVKGENKRVYNKLTARGEEVLKFFKEVSL